MKKSAGRKERRKLVRANRRAEGRYKAYAHNWARCPKIKRLSKR